MRCNPGNRFFGRDVMEEEPTQFASMPVCHVVGATIFCFWSPYPAMLHCTNDCTRGNLVFET